MVRQQHRLILRAFLLHHDMTAKDLDWKREGSLAAKMGKEACVFGGVAPLGSLAIGLVGSYLLASNYITLSYFILIPGCGLVLLFLAFLRIWEKRRIDFVIVGLSLVMSLFPAVLLLLSWFLLGVSAFFFSLGAYLLWLSKGITVLTMERDIPPGLWQFFVERLVRTSPAGYVLGSGFGSEPVRWSIEFAVPLVGYERLRYLQTDSVHQLELIAPPGASVDPHYLQLINSALQGAMREILSS